MLLLLTFPPSFPCKFFLLFVSFVQTGYRTASPAYGFVKNTLTVRRSRITFTVLTFRDFLTQRFSSRSCLKFRGSNCDRNGIYSSPTEIISDAILLAISMEPTPLLEKVSSYGLLPLIWLNTYGSIYSLSEGNKRNRNANKGNDSSCNHSKRIKKYFLSNHHEQRHATLWRSEMCDSLSSR